MTNCIILWQVLQCVYFCLNPDELGALNTMCVSACVWSGEGGERTWWIECTAKLTSSDLGSNLGFFFFKGEAVECTAKLSSNDRGSNLATTDCFFCRGEAIDSD